MRKNNDEVTKVFDWLYLGSVKNTRKTLPLVDVWYDFKFNHNEPKNLEVPENLIVHHRPFDDGDIEKAVDIWSFCFEEIQGYKEEGKKIFISCYEGVSRSAVLALWLCCEEFRDFERALNYLKSCRNIYPDSDFEPFINMLAHTYQEPQRRLSE